MSEPSNEARQAKFEQDQLRDKQINAFLLHRKTLENALANNESDLKHVGYHFPMVSKPEEMTYNQWIKDYDSRGKILVDKNIFHVNNVERAALKNEVERLNGVIEKLKAKYHKKRGTKPKKK